MVEAGAYPPLGAYRIFRGGQKAARGRERGERRGMARFIDLSHEFADDMPGFTTRLPDGARLRCTARIRPLITHAQSRASFDGKAEFELTEMTFQTSIGTYIDSPYVRHRERRDVGALRIDELVLPGVMIDLSHLTAGAAAEVEDLRRSAGAALDVAGKAVLCRFGWDSLWGQDSYFTAYPYLSRTALKALMDGGARLVGVDTWNVDDNNDAERPAHSWLLARDIFIVENLCNLAALGAAPFRFFAVPIKARGAASMPIRAFAEVT
jgi:kynurenine formamidase